MSDIPISGHLGHEHSHHGGCCKVIEVLAHAAAVIHGHHCCCQTAGDEAGCACCKESLGFVLDAIDAQTAHLRGCCGGSC